MTAPRAPHPDTDTLFELDIVALDRVSGGAETRHWLSGDTAFVIGSVLGTLGWYAHRVLK
jgi:hypothetical protein